MEKWSGVVLCLDGHDRVENAVCSAIQCISSACTHRVCLLAFTSMYRVNRALIHRILDAVLFFSSIMV